MRDNFFKTNEVRKIDVSPNQYLASESRMTNNLRVATEKCLFLTSQKPLFGQTSISEFRYARKVTESEVTRGGDRK